MKKIIGYVRDYFYGIDKRILTFSALFVAVLIFINYHYGLNHHISNLGNAEQYASWYFIFLIAFSFAYILLSFLKKQKVFSNKNFLLLFFIAPAIFSWKMAFDMDIHFSNNHIQNTYWNQIIYWPFRLAVISTMLFIVWKRTKEKQDFYGVRVRDFNFRPYLLMLLIMVPLIAAASTQADFFGGVPKTEISLLFKGPT